MLIPVQHHDVVNDTVCQHRPKSVLPTNSPELWISHAWLVFSGDADVTRRVYFTYIPKVGSGAMCIVLAHRKVIITLENQIRPGLAHSLG